MRGFLLNKNLSFYYWLKKRIGKVWAFRVANTTEKVILAFGREEIGEKLYNVKSYSGQTLTSDAWYSIDNGEGIYSGKVEETVYTYQGSKLTSHTTKTFWLDGTEMSSETWNYYSDSGREIKEKQ